MSMAYVLGSASPFEFSPCSTLRIGPGSLQPTRSLERQLIGKEYEVDAAERGTFNRHSRHVRGSSSPYSPVVTGFLRRMIIELFQLRKT